MPEALKQFATDLKADIAVEHLRTVSEFVRFPDGVRLDGNGPRLQVALALRDGLAAGRVLRPAWRRGPDALLPPAWRHDRPDPVPPMAPGRTFDRGRVGTSVALSDVHASGSEEARGWWGRFEVPAGRIGAAASAQVDAQCRDARPLLALLGVELPGWTRGLLKLDAFNAKAEVSAAPGTIRVEDLEAEGGAFRIRGRFAHDGRAGRGAFLIESGLLILGVEIEPDATKVRPLFAKQWYAKLQKQGAAGGGT